MRQEYCEKNGVLITYTDSDIAFEETDTAESILIANDGHILHNNFQNNPEKTLKYMEEFHRIYASVVYFRTLDNMGDAV